jgi:hypothetical protein
MKMLAQSWMPQAVFERARRSYSRCIYAIQDFKLSAHKLAHERSLGNRFWGHTYER